MAVTPANEGNGAPLTNLRYNATLGYIYVSNAETEAKIAAIRLTIGDTDWKKGFQGAAGDTPSARALKLAKEQGITPVKMSGRLSSVKLIDREVNGRMTPYLNVTLKDDEGRYHLSIDPNNAAAQKLARKLFNAKPGEETTVGLFATYGQKPGRDRAYAEHNATVKQNNVEVPGVSPSEALQPAIDKAKNALVAAGIDVTDKETHKKRREKVTFDYHVGLIQQVAANFAAYYEAIGAQSESPSVPATSATPAAPVAAPATTSPSAPVAQPATATASPAINVPSQSTATPAPAPAAAPVATPDPFDLGAAPAVAPAPSKPQPQPARELVPDPFVL